MDERFELDLDYNNDVSEILTKEYPSYQDLYQEAVVYVNDRGISKQHLDEILSNVDGEDNKKNVLWDYLTKLGETTQTYGTTSGGQNAGGYVQGGRKPYSSKPEEVRILGMKPLVFSLVALGTVVALGISIARLGKKATK